MEIFKQEDVLYFAKLDEEAVIPSKREEDASFDVYALVEEQVTEHEGKVQEQLLEKGKVNFVGTGIAYAVNDNYYLSAKSERSSVAKYGLNVLAGTIDSGYRGEIMLMVVPLVKDIVITNQVTEVEEYENEVLYPLSKAIGQLSLLPVPKVKVKEVDYDELLTFASERGKGGWGSSGK